MSESSKRARLSDEEGNSNSNNNDDADSPPTETGYNNEETGGGQFESSSGGRQWGGGASGSGSSNRKDHAPSKVVHIRNLNDSVTEADVKNDLARFGHINKTLFMYKKRQALVEYEDLQSAVKCVTEAAKFAVRIGGSPAYINYSPYNNLTKHE